MIEGIRRKFILVAMLSTFVVLAAIVGGMNLVNYYEIIQGADRTTHMLADNGGRFEKKAPPPSEREEGRHENPDDMSTEMPYETRYFSVCIDEAGDILSVDVQSVAAVDESAAGKYGKLAFVRKRDKGFIGIYRYRKVAVDEGSLFIFVDRRQQLKNFRAVLISSVTISLLGFGAVFFLVLIFSKIVFRPVEESYEKQKRFITDASHEFKTPLTIIDANMEVLEMEGSKNQWIASTRHQVKRLTALSRQLLALARLDEGRKYLEWTEISLTDVFFEVGQAFGTVAKKQGKEIIFSAEEGVTVYGDEAAIRHLLEILLDNAVKYAKKESVIKLQLGMKGKRRQIKVYNEVGQPFSPGKQDVLFERFYRTDASRNSEAGGSGIGLSLAKAIVDSHKGKIMAESADGKSLLVTVLL